MPDTPETPRPRLIIPGEEADRGPAPRIVLPGGGTAEPAADEPEREAPPARRTIVLPPGVAHETPADLPEYPRLRPLVLMPIRDGQRELLLVSDPQGVTPGQPVLALETLPMLQLLDGTTSLTDITAAIMRENKDLRVAGLVRDFVAQLDAMLLLDSPRFQQALAAMRDAYHPLEIRPAALEDRSYPGLPAELDPFLATHFADAEALRVEAADPQPAPNARPRAMLVPHLDPRRAGRAIARGILELGPEPAAPLRVVVLGTGHSLLGDLFALTRKHFHTPLGKARCDLAFVDALALALGDDLAYRGELAHREEHSIEFAVLYLQRRLGATPFTIVPILCGGFHTLLDERVSPREIPELELLIAAIRDTEKALGGDTVYVASVDFSHVGPRFGDPTVDARVRQEVEALDRAALDAALAGDADRWFETIAAGDDATRICGFAPTYVMLRSAGLVGGRLLDYEQSDEPDGSMVTVAAAVWD